jgi:hypothetical protein
MFISFGGAALYVRPLDNEWVLATYLEEFYLWMQQVFRLAIGVMKISRLT